MFTSSQSSACPACGASDADWLCSNQFCGKTWHLARCSRCGQHYTDPLPSSEEIAGFYAGEYHSGLRTNASAEQRFRHKFERYASFIHRFVRKGGRTLDIGCATGLLPKLLQDAGYRSEGLEFNSESVKWGCEHYGVPLRVGSIDDPGLTPASYDLISFTDVLEHFGAPLQALTRSRELLVDRGWLFVTFPDILSIESRYYQCLAQFLRRDWLWFTSHIPKHVWEFTPATARSLFAKAGFEVVAFQRAHELISAPGRLRSLTFPPRLLLLFGDRYGTRMEFMLRKSK